MAIKTLLIDRQGCIGAASCIAVYPEVYELDDENIAVFKLKDGSRTSDKIEAKALDVSSVDDETLLLSAQSCPVGAVYLYDEEGVQIYPEE
jgi:ferredoxin